MVRTAVVAAVVVLGGANVAIASDRPSAPKEELLPRLMSGQEAIDQLGSSLGEAGRRNDRTGAELATVLESDDTAHVDKRGRLVFMDKIDGAQPAPPTGRKVGPQAAAIGGTPTPQGAELPAPFPLANTFTLHSRPGSKHTAFLDFNGEHIEGTAWNSPDTGWQPAPPLAFDSAPYDIDGDPATFSDIEKQNIQLIWQRVVEDYSIFDIDITTEEPAPTAIDRAGESDLVYGGRIVVTSSNIIYQYCGCGGMSYVGNFDEAIEHAYFQPAFVHAEVFGSVKILGEIASHELGHAVGLSHDGSTTAQYYYGQGDWAPIMGSSYYRPVTQWSNGDYAVANNQEDDFSVMQQNGLVLNGDSEGASRATAVPFGSDVSAATVNGLITSRTDIDYFTFTLAEERSVNISARPSPAVPDLDIKVSLVNSSGTPVFTAAPDTVGITDDYASGMGARVSGRIPAGTYVVEIDGSGSLDPAVYSDYGSVGPYSIELQSSVGSLAPVADITASQSYGPAPLTVSLSSAESYDGDGSIVSYLWDFGNGQTSTASSAVAVYPTVGTYTVSLTVTDNAAMSTTTTRTLQVNTNIAPVARGFADPATVNLGEQTVLWGRDSDDIDGGIVSYHWDFGDGDTSDARDQVVIYRAAGVYSARLTVVDTSGASSTAVVVVTVLEPGTGTTLAARFVATPSSGFAPLAVDFSSAASTGTIVSRSWDFGDGRTSALANPSMTFTTPGIFTVTLTVTDDTNTTATKTGTVTVKAPGQNGLPVAVAVAEPSTVTVGATLVLWSTGSTDPDGSIVSYHWDFGNGSSSDYENQAVIYYEPGMYTVTLTVTDDLGATAVKTLRVTVLPIGGNTAPVAIASGAPLSGNAPLTVALNGSASSDGDGSIVSYAWNLGDGSTSTVANPTATYTSPGTYLATLTVTDNLGGVSPPSSALTITVAAAPPPPSTIIYSIGNRIWNDRGAGATFGNGVLDAGEVGIDGVEVALFNINAAGTPTTQVGPSLRTAGGGYYRFDQIAPGSYMVVVMASNFAPGGPLKSMASSTGAVASVGAADVDGRDRGNDRPIGAGSAAGGISSGIVQVGPGSQPTGETDPAQNPSVGEDSDEASNRAIDFGFRPVLPVANTIRIDTNNDGVPGESESGIAGVTLELFAGQSCAGSVTGQPIATTVTSDTGEYSFTTDQSGAALNPGCYAVGVAANNFAPDGALYQSRAAGATITRDGKVIGEAPIAQSVATAQQLVTPQSAIVSSWFSLGDGQVPAAVGFGFYRACISGTIWFDQNRNGRNDPTDTRVASASVGLFSADGLVELDRVATDADGTYQFCGAAIGSYVVRVTTPPGLFLTKLPNAGVTSTIITSPEGRRVLITFAADVESGGWDLVSDPTSAGNSVVSVDLGLYRPLALPTTGADVGTLLRLALGAFAVGLVFVGVGRRRKHA
jgi:PKD repeat protein